MTETLLRSASCIRRVDKPVLTHEQVPFPATCIFNAGVCKFRGRYVMLFRNDVGEHGKLAFHTTNLGVACSDDGIN